MNHKRMDETMRKKLRGKNHPSDGFTLVEIMFVVLLLGMLVGLSVPGFIRNREESQATVCRDNLRQINSAIQQYMLENTTTNVPAITDPDIGIYFQAGSAPTNCPTGVFYAMPLTGQDSPTCAIGANHVYPWNP